MTIRPVQSVASKFGFEALRFRPPEDVMRHPLAESAAAIPTGHCQSHHRRTETGRSRNASASLTLNRVRPASVPKSAPVGGFAHCARACPEFFGGGIYTRRSIGAEGLRLTGPFFARPSGRNGAVRKLNQGGF